MPRLTLSMIVKNEEKYIKDCLESVKNIADEIVIVDTGSTDNTIKISESYGAKVYSFEWVNDFSAARNYALGKSTGDWILYVDADERLDVNSIDEIKRITATPRDIGFYCTVNSFDTEESRDNSMRYVRLFANSPAIKFTGKVHEQITPSLIKNNYTLINSRVLINHIGYNISKEEKQNKAKRNLALLHDEFGISKSSYYAFQLAQTYNILNDIENAVKYFKIAAGSADLDKSLRAQCYCSLSLIAHQTHKIAEAEKNLQLSLQLDDKQPFTYLLASKIALRKGDLLSAESRCKSAHQLNQNLIFQREQTKLLIFLDPEEVIFYGLTLALRVRNITNINYYQKELSDYYTNKKSKESLARLTVIQKLFQHTLLNPNEEAMLVEMANNNTMNFFLLMLAGNRNREQVFQLANYLLRKFPNSIEIKKIIAILLDEFGRVDEAIKILENEVTELQQDPAVFFYLISFYLKIGMDEKIKPLITRLEKNFSHINEVMERVRKLRRKLLMLTNVPF